MRIVSLYNWHDASYCVLEDGKIKSHVELERHIRTKETYGDSLLYLKNLYMKKNNLTLDDVDVWLSIFPETNLSNASKDVCFDTHDYISKNKFNFLSHHMCHAAHAYYSSPFNDAIIISIDSAGLETADISVSIGVYKGKDNRIEKIFNISNSAFSLGSVWSRCTRFIFKLSSGYPMGHQAGSVMAMAALGRPEKYYADFMKMFRADFRQVTAVPPGCKRGVYVRPEDDVIHPYLNKYRVIAESNPQEMYDMAASLQAVTEHLITELIKASLTRCFEAGFVSKNVCFSGGVSLNSLAMGKIVPFDAAIPTETGDVRFSLENIFIPPVPYDGGMTIGACQYYWHHVLGNPKDNVFVPSYQGESYSFDAVDAAINACGDSVVVANNVGVDACVDLLIQNKIVAVFNSRSESGRRALGNRSILASPSDPKMKDWINEKVKHRQWYRPFAPSVLEDCAADWFDGFFPSPYMSFVFKFKKDKIGRASAVEHLDGTARIQSINREQNKYYYDLINAFYVKSGIPMVLNTSFNDREPICDSPQHAIDCFLRTDIDYLYFVEHKILLSRKGK